MSAAKILQPGDGNIPWPDGGERRNSLETWARAQNVNGLFTATGKKSVCGRRTEPRIHPLLTRAGSPRVDPTLNVSTSDVGVSMKLGFPWSVKDIRPEARDTAREAARRAGLPVNEWLNAVILQQVNGQNANAFARSNNSGSADHESQNYSQVHLRLDNLARRMDQVTRRGPAAYAPKRNREEADQVAELITRLEQRFDQFAAAGPAAMPVAPPRAQWRAGAGPSAAADAGLVRPRKRIAPDHQPDRDIAASGRGGSDQCVARRAWRNWTHAQRGDAASCPRSH
jgi:hypothetical protein